jgi:hypothetical protein
MAKPKAPRATRPEATPEPRPLGGGVEPPRPTAPFFGREAELSSLAARFDAGARLVTLLGPGGIGNSTGTAEFFSDLAVEMSADFTSQFTTDFSDDLNGDGIADPRDISPVDVRVSFRKVSGCENLIDKLFLL